jgi:CRISPR/Cas system endoribonuclease Cas6 (RAMP superfamily)
MRIRVHLRAPPPIVIPLNYAHQLASVVYHLLDRSSPAYATFLHGRAVQATAASNCSPSSPIFGHPRQVVAGHSRFETTAVSWCITSPVEAFIRHVVRGDHSRIKGTILGRITKFRPVSFPVDIDIFPQQR